MQSACVENAPPTKLSNSITLSNEEKCYESSSEDVPFSILELNALLEATRRASRMIHGNYHSTAQLDKTIWIQITNHLHARGFQSRPWQQVRSKGQELISKLFEKRLKSVPMADFSPTDDKGSTAFRHPGAPEESSDGQLAQMFVSVVHSLNLPSLTPAPNVASGTTFQTTLPGRPNMSVPFVISSCSSVNPYANSVELNSAMFEANESHRVPLQVIRDPSCLICPSIWWGGCQPIVDKETNFHYSVTYFEIHRSTCSPFLRYQLVILNSFRLVRFVNQLIKRMYLQIRNNNSYHLKREFFCSHIHLHYNIGYSHFELFFLKHLKPILKCSDSGGNLAILLKVGCICE
ncbi:hypothetical protein FGIG_10142 [Fasciola gigantica]|uniref:Uncharacterized protein n=1 Tax=Fasciola gigantica TaxID=46835 RepID=A0A504YCR9_FASGI|nr:hypothetical protein FGIG_10142 [Fasciola gigantica]